jgi:tetratricopeptide (TPR) repeat protein
MKLLKIIWSGLGYYVKTALGILLIAALIGGVATYFAWRNDPIVYRFNPESAYVYTFHGGYFTVNYSNPPAKSVSLFTDGFNPGCLFGCKRPFSAGQVKSELILSPISDREEDKRKESRFVYLRSNNQIKVSFDMNKGPEVKDKYPYVNRVILETKSEKPGEELTIAVRGYEFSGVGEDPSEPVETLKYFSFTRTFGDSSVFELKKPVFATEVLIRPERKDDGFAGIRGLGIYLARSEYRSRIAGLKEALPGLRNEEGSDVEELGRIKKGLQNSFGLDPYSPETNYLLSRADYQLENFKVARKEINHSIQKAERYEGFLRREVRMTDLYAQKARVARGLEDWDAAINYMKRATPEVDHEFLSGVYLSKYEASGVTDDLTRSFYQATLAFKETPRLSLEVLKKYRKNRHWLAQGLRYFDSEVTGTEAGSYRLYGGESVSPYAVNLALGLLELWSSGEGNYGRALTWLEKAEKSSESREKNALVAALKSRVYGLTGENAKAKKLKREALNFFGNYAGLYASWEEFLS